MNQAGESPSSSSPPSFFLTAGATGRVSLLCSQRALRALLRFLNMVVLLLFLPFGSRRTGEKQTKKVAPLKLTTSSSLAVENEVVVRRATAIKRVMDDNEDGKTMRDFSVFIVPRGHAIFTQSWTPVITKVRGLVILLHGLNEHSGRYNDFAKELNGKGLKVYGMDWIGHGGSDELHAYVHSLDDAVDDLKLFQETVLVENPGLPCFFFGHSTGAAIILKAALDPKVEAQTSGIAMTSPAVGIPSPVHIVLLAPIIATLFPKIQIPSANKQGILVSRDPDALLAKYSDPLVYTGSIRARTGYEILRISSHLQQYMRNLKVPFFLLHGTDDLVTDPNASKRLYEEALSTDKSIKLCPGLLHDLLFEPEREAIMRDIIEWFDCRV